MPSRAVLHRSRRSTASVVGSAACFATTLAYLAMAWMIVFAMRIGPVVGVVDAGAGRGVHAGDLLAIPLVLTALFVYSEGLLGLHRRSRTRATGHRSDEWSTSAVIRILPASSALSIVHPSAA